MPLIVTKITPTIKNSNRFSVYINEEFAFALGAYVLAKYKISEKLQLKSLDVYNILLDENLEYLKTRSLDLISRRPRSEKEIIDNINAKLKNRINKLAKIQNVSFDNFQNDLTNKVLDFLKKYNYINDLEFAKWLTNQRINQNKGKLVIKQDLIKKGISKEIITSVLEDADFLDSINNAYALALKKYSKEEESYKKKQKIYNFLLRKGYTYDQIENLISQ